MKLLKKLNTTQKLLLSVLLILSFLSTAIIGYVSTYYHGGETALSYYTEEYMSPKADAPVQVQEKNKKLTLFVPEEVKAGLIFYPGGKVEDIAYAPLLYRLSENGILCALVKMPANLAVLSPKVATEIRTLLDEEYPEIHSWYMAGHSLGGAMAASYLEDHASEYQGLILLAAYATGDLSQSNLKVLSIYGDQDGVLNMEKYEEGKANLPPDYEEVVIPGGCHCHFGDYGEQDKDGIPSITREEQWQATVDAILHLIF